MELSVNRGDGFDIGRGEERERERRVRAVGGEQGWIAVRIRTGLATKKKTHLFISHFMQKG